MNELQDDDEHEEPEGIRDALSMTASTEATLAFRTLDPLTILDAIDEAGHRTDGRVSSLNSYENRVYDIGLEDGSSIVAKFYRPDRWSDEAILEEHDFTLTLLEAGLPVVAPLETEDGETLLETGPFRFCLFPKHGGRAPELDNPEQLKVVGRTIARLHLVGADWEFDERPFIDADRLGASAIEYLAESPLVPDRVRDAYESTAWELLERVEERIDEAGEYEEFAIHGDMHPGNILWGHEPVPHILDFDDTATGPAIQDLWMFISGDRDYAEARLGNLLDGYSEFRRFDETELLLIEPLRTLRMINYAAWIAERWADPAFKRAFPYFEGERYWDEHLQTLKDQRVALDEPPLRY